MNVASGVLSELMSAKMDISKERFEMFTNITVRFKFQTWKYRMGFISKVQFKVQSH